MVQHLPVKQSKVRRTRLEPLIAHRIEQPIKEFRAPALDAPGVPVLPPDTHYHLRTGLPSLYKLANEPHRMLAVPVKHNCCLTPSFCQTSGQCAFFAKVP